MGRAPTAEEVLLQDVARAAEVVEQRAAARKWKLDVLANKAGKPHTSFNNWKQGHHPPKLETILAFCQAVGARVRVLVQDAATSEAADEGESMPSQDAMSLARLFDELDHEDRIRVDVFIHALRTKKTGSSSGPR